MQLFVDIVRSVSPTHIIRLLPTISSTMDTIRHLPPLTEAFFTSTPGLFTPAEKGCGLSNAQPTCVPVPSVLPGSGISESGGPAAVEETCQAEVGGDSSSDVDMFGSSDEGFEVSDSSR